MAMYFGDEAILNTEHWLGAAVGGALGGMQAGMGLRGQREGLRNERARIKQQQEIIDLQRARDQWEQERDMARYGLQREPEGIEVVPRAGGVSRIEDDVASFRAAAGRAIAPPGSPPPGVLERPPSVTEGITHGTVIPTGGELRPAGYGGGGGFGRTTPAFAAREADATARSYVVSEMLKDTDPNKPGVQGRSLEDIRGDLAVQYRDALASEDAMRVGRYLDPERFGGAPRGRPELSDIKSVERALRGSGTEQGNRLADILASPQGARIFAESPTAFLGAIDDEEQMRQRAFEIAQQQWTMQMMFMPEKFRAGAENFEDYYQQVLERMRQARNPQRAGTPPFVQGRAGPPRIPEF